MPHSSGIDIVASIRHCVARATHKVTDRAGLAAVHREIEVEQGQPCALPLPGRTGPARLMMYYKDTGGYARARLALREAAPTWSPRSSHRLGLFPSVGLAVSVRLPVWLLHWLDCHPW